MEAARTVELSSVGVMNTTRNENQVVNSLSHGTGEGHFPGTGEGTGEGHFPDL